VVPCPHGVSHTGRYWPAGVSRLARQPEVAQLLSDCIEPVGYRRPPRAPGLVPGALRAGAVGRLLGMRPSSGAVLCVLQFVLCVTRLSTYLRYGESFSLAELGRTSPFIARAAARISASHDL
jgi:hypothetical protein